MLGAGGPLLLPPFAGPLPALGADSALSSLATLAVSSSSTAVGSGLSWRCDELSAVLDSSLACSSGSVCLALASTSNCCPVRPVADMLNWGYDQPTSSS